MQEGHRQVRSADRSGAPTRSHAASGIASLTGIPPQMLGMLADAHRKDLEAQAQQRQLSRQARRVTPRRPRQKLAAATRTLRNWALRWKGWGYRAVPGSAPRPVRSRRSRWVR
jgi:hypothetical protein